jgi:hypothetical protein
VDVILGILYAVYQVKTKSFAVMVKISRARIGEYCAGLANDEQNVMVLFRSSARC